MLAFLIQLLRFCHLKKFWKYLIVDNLDTFLMATLPCFNRLNHLILWGIYWGSSFPPSLLPYSLLEPSCLSLPTSLLWSSVQVAYSSRRYLHSAGSVHGHAVHAWVGVSGLDAERQPGQHLVSAVRWSLAEQDEGGKWGSGPRSRNTSADKTIVKNRFIDT